MICVHRNHFEIGCFCHCKGHRMAGLVSLGGLTGIQLPGPPLTKCITTKACLETCISDFAAACRLRSPSFLKSTQAHQAGGYPRKWPPRLFGPAVMTMAAVTAAKSTSGELATAAVHVRRRINIFGMRKLNRKGLGCSY